jgi:hypothetical protein
MNTKKCNKVGLTNLAIYFFNLQKSVPQSRYIDPEYEEEESVPLVHNNRLLCLCPKCDVEHEKVFNE